LPEETCKIGRDRELPSLERLMALVDYYVHCELDEDHAQGRPEVARQQLKAAVRQVLLHASSDTMRDRLKISGDRGQPARVSEACRGNTEAGFVRSARADLSHC
jgi:hypothetical protein